jgi:hypothetical protein
MIFSSNQPLMVADVWGEVECLIPLGKREREWKSLRQESSNALEPTAGSKGAVCFTGMSLDRSFDGPVGTPNLDIPFVPSIYHVCQW